MPAALHIFRTVAMPSHHLSSRRLRPLALALGGLLTLGTPTAWASSDHGAAHTETPQPKPEAHAAPAAHAEPAHAESAHAAPAATAEPTSGQDTISRLKAVIEKHGGKGGSVSLRVGGHVIAATNSHSTAPAADASHSASEHKPRPAKASPKASRDYIRARAAVLSGHDINCLNVECESEEKIKF